MATHTVKECAALFRRAVGGLTVLILALISTNGPGQEEGKQAEQLRTGIQPNRDNERIVTEPDGAKVVFIRWPVGSRDNIVTLRVPMAYVPLGTTPLGRNNRDSNHREPSPTTKVFDIDAMLWDMDPLPRDRQLTTEQRNMVVFGTIESIYAGSRIRNEAQQLKLIAKARLEGIRRNYYQTRYRLPIVEKPGRFDLRRIGAVHDLGGRTPVGLNDFYYSGDQPETANDFLLCTDEAVPDDPPSGKFANPGCQQWFALSELSATVKATYRRRHLGEWREIKRRVSELILSWKPPDVGGAAGSSTETVSKLRCTIDPNEIMRKADGGATCTFDVGP